MKPAYILTIFFLISFGCFAQKSDTLVTYNFGGDYYKTAKSTETYKVEQKDNFWIRTTFNNQKTVIRTETFADRKLKKLNGDYLEYENGTVSQKGSYLDNQKTGLWTSFDAESKPKETKTYLQDKLNGPYTTYWKNGLVKVSGNYTNDAKTGEWKINYEDGKTALRELYDSKNKLTDSTYLDRDGDAVAKADITTEPTFEGGMKKFYMFLGKGIRYPIEARNSRIQGKVYIAFQVNSNGKISDIKITSAPDSSLAEESIRVMQQSPDWIPATLFGKPITVPYSININFSIN